MRGIYGKLILWEVSDSLPGRIMVRARVTNIQEVPQFIAYSNSLGLHGDSWTIQCEVMQHHPLDQGPPIEDPVPDELDLKAMVPFDFFGLGQPVVQQEQEDQQNDAEALQDQIGNGGLHQNLGQQDVHDLQENQEQDQW